MKTPTQDNLDPTTLNMATFNDPAMIADAAADAEDYMPYIFEHPIFKDFNASLPGKDILDLGSGPGLLSKHYSDEGYNVTGIDFSENMVKAAEKQCPKCRFIAKNVLDLDTTDGKFDGILAFHLAQYLDSEQMVKLFKKVSEALSGGGKFMIVFTNTCHPKSGYNTCSAGLTEYWNQWKIEDITPLFKKGGLNIIKFEQPKLANGEEPFFFIAEKGA